MPDQIIQQVLAGGFPVLLLKSGLSLSQFSGRKDAPPGFTSDHGPGHENNRDRQDNDEEFDVELGRRANHIDILHDNRKLSQARNDSVAQ